jgi:DNA-binding beta-propeller fold protein YncE
VFVQSDNQLGNTVTVYDRGADGSLTPAGAPYATGGLGGQLDGSVGDYLASEGSLVYDQSHGLLFAVNAGSDTVSVFAVRGSELAPLQVLSSGGSFPVGIAVHGNLVYVVNALDGGSLQGYLIAFDRLIPLPGSTRSLGLAVVSGPMQYVNTPGEVAFTPDGSRLIVTTKDNGDDIDVFNVDRFGELSATTVVNSEPATVPFGFVFDPAGRLQVTEAGPSDVATFSLAPNGTLAQLATVATGQPATCWITADGPYLYASNAGGPSLSTISIAPWGSSLRCSPRRRPTRGASTPQPRRTGASSTPRPAGRESSTSSRSALAVR